MPTTPLPEGQNGIAAAYLDDANIGADPDVLFADDFESYSSKSELWSNWSNFFQQHLTRIATEADNVFSGDQSLEFKLPQTSSEVANAVVKDLGSTEDQLFVRVYTKFDSGYDTGDGHNGIEISSNYPGPGNVPDGSDFFMFMLENSQYYNEGDLGYTHVYAYHPEQRGQWGDHWYPDGRVLPYDSTPGDFGPDFVARPNFIPETDKWYSYEFMVQANTPGADDGRVAAWIDGDLVADFQNLRMRDISSLKIDRIALGLHSKGSPQENTKWYDDVVVARSYIGPMSTSSSPPTDTTGDHDVIIGDANGNNLAGGDGDDTLGGDLGEDTFDGGGGSDTVDYSYSSSDRLRVDLSEGFAWFVDDPNSPVGTGNEASTTEVLMSIENVIGSRGDNVIIGDANDNVLTGHFGQDTFDGGGGSDTVDYSYSFQDRLRVDLSEDRAWFVDDPTSPAGPGNEPSTTEVLTSVENVVGSRGDNVLIGDADENRLDGGQGDDTLTGGGDNDVFVFGNKYDRDTVTDFDDGPGSDVIDARETGLNTVAEFNELAESGGDEDLVDSGDNALGIEVSVVSGDLVMDFGGGDVLTVLNETYLLENEFILV